MLWRPLRVGLEPKVEQCPGRKEKETTRKSEAKLRKFAILRGEWSLRYLCTVLDVEDGMDDGDEAFQPILPPVKSKS